MKKNELVLGNIVKAYKGETEFKITSILDEVVILDNEKEVKTSTLLKNYKMVRATEVENIISDVKDKESERNYLDAVDAALAEVDPVVPEVESNLVENPIEEVPEVNSKEEEPQETPKEEKKKEVIYGIKVSKGINQTLIWKVLKKVCENMDDEGIKIAIELKTKYPEVFEGAKKCLVSKKRIAFIDKITAE